MYLRSSCCRSFFTTVLWTPLALRISWLSADKIKQYWAHNLSAGKAGILILKLGHVSLSVTLAGDPFESRRWGLRSTLPSCLWKFLGICKERDICSQVQTVVLAQNLPAQCSLNWTVNKLFICVRLKVISLGYFECRRAIVSVSGLL